MQTINNSKAIDLFILYGSAASEVMFDYPCHFFQIPSCTGVIAYRLESKCAVIFGDPICPSNELSELTQAFHKYCNDSHLNVIYITVSEKFARLAQEYCPILIEACEELIFDPQINPSLKSHRLQHRMDKATNHGLTFHEYIPFNEGIEKSLLEIGIKWKNSKGPRIHLGHLNFFENPKGKRWFYVKEGELITAMAMLSQLDAHKGWLLKFFFTIPNAYHETSEFLMVSLLMTLKNENCQFLTKGMVPIDSLGEMKGLGYCRSKLMQYIYTTINFIYKFKKHKEYWERYHSKKVPSYLLFSKLGVNEMRALSKVLRVKI